MEHSHKSIQQVERRYILFAETTNESLSFGYTSIPIYVRHNIAVIKQKRDKRFPIIDFNEKTVHLLNFGRYIIVLRIFSAKQSEMLFLDYCLPINTILALNILTSKEIAVLAEMREWMINTNNEKDDESVEITSIYN